MKKFAIKTEELEDKEMRDFLIDNRLSIFADAYNLNGDIYYYVFDNKIAVSSGKTKEKAVKNAMKNIEQIKKDRKKNFLEDIQKGNPVTRKEFAEYLNSMFGLENEKLEQLVDFMAKMNNIVFSNKSQSIDITSAYLKMMETYKPEPFDNLEQKFYLLDNKADMDKLHPMEKDAYNKMIDEIQHYKDIYDRENINILVSEIRRKMSMMDLPVLNINQKERFIKKFGKEKFQFVKNVEDYKKVKEKKKKSIYISDIKKSGTIYAYRHDAQSYQNNDFLSLNEAIQKMTDEVKQNLDSDIVTISNITQDYVVITDESSLKDFKIIQEGKVYCVSYVYDNKPIETKPKSKIDEMNEYWQEFLEWKKSKDTEKSGLEDSWKIFLNKEKEND